MKVRMRLSDIVIPKHMRETPPKESKMNKIRAFYREHKCVDKPVVVNQNNLLLDGYIRYLVRLENNAEWITVEKPNVEPQKYVRVEAPTQNNITEQYSTTIISIYNDVVKTYESNVALIKQCEDELNDLNHEIELSKPKDMYKGYLCYKAIRDVRNRRRIAKNENQLLQDLYDFIKSKTGQDTKTKFQQIQGNSIKTFEAQSRMIYIPRQREDLTIANTHSESTKDFEQMITEFNQKNKISREKGKLKK